MHAAAQSQHSSDPGRPNQCRQQKKSRRRRIYFPSQPWLQRYIILPPHPARAQQKTPENVVYAFLKKLIMLACFPPDLGAAFFGRPAFSPPPPDGFFAPLSAPAAGPSAALFSKPPPPFLAFLASGAGTRVWFVLAGCSGSCGGRRECFLRGI